MRRFLLMLNPRKKGSCVLLIDGMMDTLYLLAQGVTLLIALYQFSISLFGIVRRREKTTHEASKRFAVFIPAHNEERVVGPLIESLKSQHYPKELFDIHLIADNCTDHTADVGRFHGAIVHERQDLENVGKGHAIKWILDKLNVEHVSYDAIVMFDADNLVHYDFLRIMNDKLCSGHKVIQGYLGVKNPFDTWITVSLAITYWFDNRMWQYARSRLGLSCALGGTGLCIDYSVLHSVGWKGSGLTEDLEFGVRCLQNGFVPVWAHDAIVYDEKPLSLIASFHQRLRWLQGHFNCARCFMGQLLRESIRERSFVKFDMAVYLFQPMRTLIVFAMSTMLYVFNLPAFEGTSSLHVQQFIPEPVWVLASLVVFLEMALALALERVNWRAYVGLILVPFFLWTWGLVSVQAFFTRRNEKWHHTQHRRVIRIDELQES